MRLIDADRLLAFIEHDAKIIAPEKHSTEDIIMIIKTSPTVEAQPKGSQPNGPLTLAELCKMDGEAVWCENYQCDGIVSVDPYGRWENVPFLICRITGVNCTYNIEDRELTIYRYKPTEVQQK